MPREIVTSVEASRILSIEKIRYLEAVTEMAHSEIIYELITSAGSILKCDFCGIGAKYIHHTRDHLGQNFIALTCISCAPPGYTELSALRSSG